MHETLTAPASSDHATHAAPHQELGFIRKYIFSTDHKVVGMQYMITGLVMALLGGFLAYVIRHQLAFPGEKMLFHPVVQARQYYTMITMHGTIMVFWVAMPILIGGFGNFLIPLMCGADDMAFPKLNMLSYWVFFVSTVILIASFFVPGGAAAGGWTSYPSLSVQVGNPNKWGQLVWILAVAFEFVSILMGGVNYLTTPLNMRAPGMKMMQLPMFVWMQMTASLLFMMSVGPLIGGAVLMICDILFQTGVYMPDRGGDPLLWQHLFWFFGHPEVYIILLPCIGIISEVIPTMARKSLFGYKAITYSAIAAGILSIVVWAHHQFVSGMDPRLAMPFSIATIIISVPFSIMIFSLIATFWGGSIKFNAAMLWSVGMLAEFLFGGVTGIINGSAAADIYVHDTYYIVGHFHFTLFPAVFYGMFAGLYFWWPKFTGRHLDERLGKVHFWGTSVFFNMTFLPMMFLGIMGHQRRVFDPRIFAYLNGSNKLHLISTYGIFGLWIFQIPFIVAFCKGLFGKKNAERNPWHGTTLEWLAPSPPGHGNFDTLPVCYRAPYEFSLPDQKSDYLPQWVSDEEAKNFGSSPNDSDKAPEKVLSI